MNSITTFTDDPRDNSGLHYDLASNCHLDDFLADQLDFSDRGLRNRSIYIEPGYAYGYTTTGAVCRAS